MYKFTLWQSIRKNGSVFGHPKNSDVKRWSDLYWRRAKNILLSSGPWLPRFGVGQLIYWMHRLRKKNSFGKHFFLEILGLLPSFMFFHVCVTANDTHIKLWDWNWTENDIFVPIDYCMGRLKFVWVRKYLNWN